MKPNPNKKYLAAYGSLRLGQYNYRYFKNIFKEDFIYIRTTTIKGYSLYDLGSYPCVIFDSEDLSPLTVDIFECSEEVYALIKDMELGANYFENTINVDGLPCGIYVYKESDIWNRSHLVESGDWSKYLIEAKEPF